MKEKFLEDLRELYRQGEVKKMKDKYALGKWMLSDEERERIEKVLPSETALDYCKKQGWEILTD